MLAKQLPQKVNEISSFQSFTLLRKFPENDKIFMLYGIDGTWFVKIRKDAISVFEDRFAF